MTQYVPPADGSEEDSRYPEPTHPKPRWIYPLVLMITGGVIGVLLVGALVASANRSFELWGNFEVVDSSGYYYDSACGTGGYSDIAEGADVTVYNSEGDIIGAGELLNVQDGSGSSTLCTAEIYVADVPEGESYYAIEVTNRGKVTFTPDEVENEEVGIVVGY